MIISGLLSIVKMLVQLLFGWISLPQVPSGITTVVDQVFGYMQAGAGVLWFFIPQDLVLLLLPLVIVVANFDHLYKLGMWILRKIPMLGVN